MALVPSLMVLAPSLMVLVRVPSLKTESLSIIVNRDAQKSESEHSYSFRCSLLDGVCACAILNGPCAIIDGPSAILDGPCAILDDLFAVLDCPFCHP